MISLLLAPTLSIPAGYFTLAELGTTLERQGVQVRVGSDCADDVYAIRAPRTDWPSFRAALVADGRLTISEDDGTWNIALDAANRAREKTTADRYIGSAKEGLSRAYVPFAERARQVFLLADERQPDAEEEVERDLPPGLRARFSFGINDHDYAIFGVPATLLNEGLAPGEGKIWNVFDVPFAIEPTGDLRKHPQVGSMLTNVALGGERTALAGFLLGGKLVWDPPSLATGYRWSFWTSNMASDLGELEYVRAEMLTPTGIALNAPLLSRPTKPIEQADEWTLPVPTPSRSLPASEAMLRWAEGAKVNLAAFVPAMGDFSLPSSGSWSLRGIAGALNAGQVDPKRRADEAYEWSGLYDRRPRIFALRPALRATPLKASGFSIVRRDDGFLGRFCGDKPTVPTAWMNARRKGESVSLASIVSTIAATKPQRWKNGLFACDYLDWCNPVSFQPFAALFVADADLLRRASAVEEGKQLVLPLSGLRKASVLREALAAAAPYSDTLPGRMLDPTFVPFYVREPSAPLSLTLFRRGDRLRLGVAAAVPREGGVANEVWSSWVRLTQ